MRATTIADFRVVECRRRFRYIPDAEGKTALERLLNDVWEDPELVEERGGADCDGLSIWTLVRGWQDAIERDAEWRLVAGDVLVQKQWLGHAWGSVVQGGVETWHDAMWNLRSAEPSSLGWPGTRRPRSRWTFNGRLFVQQHDYPVT